MSDPAATGMKPLVFWAGAITLSLIVAAVAWFAMPAGDTTHRFASPSGRNALELTENCSETGCLRTITREEVAADGSRTKRNCTVQLAEPRPLWLNAHPLWSADEASVDIVYADAAGEGGKLTLDLVRDCAG